jgi:hypothetical protein
MSECRDLHERRFESAALVLLVQRRNGGSHQFISEGCIVLSVRLHGD